MVDLYLAIAVLAALSFLLFACSGAVARRLPGPASDLLGVVVVALAGLYACALWQDVSLARLLPFSNLVVLGNWFPLLASVLAGLAARRIPGGWARKCLVIGSLCATAWLSVIFPLLGGAPHCGDAWTTDGFCLQTTEQTCTAACAASLLRGRGIAATEQELARLCLTRDGTTWQGLYRGLKIKTGGTPWDVRVVHGDVSCLLENANGPMILSVGLARDVRVDGAFQREYGWKRGWRHSVILLNRKRGSHVEILDPNPAIGREWWHAEDLQLLYQGPAIQLVARQP